MRHCFAGRLGANARRRHAYMIPERGFESLAAPPPGGIRGALHPRMNDLFVSVILPQEILRFRLWTCLQESTPQALLVDMPLYRMPNVEEST